MPVSARTRSRLAPLSVQSTTRTLERGSGSLRSNIAVLGPFFPNLGSSDDRFSRQSPGPIAGSAPAWSRKTRQDSRTQCGAGPALFAVEWLVVPLPPFAEEGTRAGLDGSGSPRGYDPHRFVERDKSASLDPTDVMRLSGAHLREKNNVCHCVVKLRVWLSAV